MRIQEMDMREMGMSGKEQERMGKPSESFYKIENQLTIQLVPQKGNERLLAAVPHIRWLDLAMVFRIYREEEGCSLSLLIGREQLSDWNVTVEEVARKAMEHMPRLLPVKLCGVTEELERTAKELGLMPPKSPEPEDGLKLYLLTNQMGYNGAAAILYEGVLKNFAEEVGKDLILLPSSIHEVLLLPDNGDSDYEGLSALVREVNKAQVRREEWLSDHVYRYLKEEDRIIAAGNGTEGNGVKGGVWG